MTESSEDNAAEEIEAVQDKDDAPWYAKGLPFECTGCGDCCRGPGGHVWLTQDEAEAMAAELEMTPDEFGEWYLRQIGDRLALVDGANGNCVFLDVSGKCTVYESRPVQCRTYPWWPEVIESRRFWEQESRLCEGIGRTVIVPLATIQAQLQKVKKSAKI